VEDTVVATEELATLQFNSLCIRMPDAHQKLGRQDSGSLPVSKFREEDAPQGQLQAPSRLLPSYLVDESRN
jgi:hypothetical protein